ncbi:hypothetical protein CWT12_12305 [Actinomyces sp. 432]|uniref:terminase small subunit n=1 Tax=Actinomyces sp. 432 TaxID=2057798 RepID=UPI001374120E|nr:hypothetical protein [Actinomyces sp. 432]QHO91934.1 hypothetical protein CWT12_12305 [Actinomyces sp. 432]
MDKADSMVDAVERALAGASWLTDADAAAVALLRRLAARLDDPYFPIVEDGRFDNVSESLFLKTAAGLGLTPEMRAAWEKKDKKANNGRLETLRKGTANLRAV